MREMSRAEALETLTEYNKWRRGEDSRMSVLNMNTEYIGRAIDTAIVALTTAKGKAPCKQNQSEK